MLRSSARILHQSVRSLVGVLPGLPAEGNAGIWHRCTTGSNSSSLLYVVRALSTKPQGLSFHELQHPHELQPQQEEQELQDQPPHPHHQLSQQHANKAECSPSEALQMDSGDQMEQAPAAASTSVLRDVLEAEQISFPALMSALKCNSRQPLQPDVVVSNIKALKGFFGTDMVNKMVAAAPLVLQRRPEMLKAHYDGLRDVLGGNDRLLHDIVTRVPDILNHAPATVRGRITELCTIFQVDEQDILRLVKKAPVLLRREPSRVAACVQYLQEVSGLSSKEVFKVFLSWPLMATSSKELFVTRYQALQAVLKATPEDMQRICSVYPSILVRDPSQLGINIASIAQQLQLPLEEVVAISLKNPSLLSWNVSTLLSRVAIICLTLQLPPELRVSLLTHNKTLLTHHADIPERVEHLKKLLGLQEAELLPLLHSKLTVLRLPVELMEGKMALVNSLAQLHPAWTTDLQDLMPQSKLQLLQAGESRFWRLVYLAHTSQQGCGSVKSHLTASRATFYKLFPRFRCWLDRYNHIVTSNSIPLIPPFAPDGGQGPAHYTPVTLDSSLNHRTAPVGQRAPLPDTHAALATQNTTSCSPSSTESAAVLPPTAANILAAWWGVELDDAQDFLSKLWRQYSWHEWQQRLSALEDLMALLGWLPQQSSDTGSDSSSSGSCGQGGSTAYSPAAAGSPLLPVAAAAAAGAEAADEVPQQGKPAAHQRRFMLRQEAQEALQHAVSSNHAAAVAAVSVACHLAPFNKQLHQLPSRPPDLAVKFALQHPAVISKSSFVSVCNSLAALAAENDFLRHQMHSLDLAGLSRCLNASATLVKYVQYLVATQQPIPWVYNLSQLLMQQRFTSKSKGGRRAEFVAAYPGYEAWEKAMHEL